LAVVIAACASSVEPPVIVTSEPTALEEPAATTAEPATPLAEPAVTTPEPTQRAGTRPRFVLGSQAEPVRMVKGPNGDITVHAASVMVEGGEHTQLTADRITQTPDSLVLEGNVQLVFEGASMTATRAVAQQAADGSMTFKAENAVIATRRRQ
jgi:hypothetical protein